MHLTNYCFRNFYSLSVSSTMSCIWWFRHYWQVDDKTESLIITESLIKTSCIMYYNFTLYSIRTEANIVVPRFYIFQRHLILLSGYGYRLTISYILNWQHTSMKTIVHKYLIGDTLKYHVYQSCNNMWSITWPITYICDVFDRYW